MKKKKKKKSERPRVGFDPVISRFEVEHTNHYAVLDLFQARQKDNVRVDSSSCDCGENFLEIHMEHV